jgi:exopolyphosphatase/guanosine-5'-triphosphate,3'-diphosphate pyrophosphatase
MTNDTGRTIGVIDIGSNSVRMVIAQVLVGEQEAAVPADAGSVAGDIGGKIEILEQMRQPAHLGHDTYVNGRLSQRSINATVSILREYARVLDAYEVEHIRAVATAAVREAGNADAFVDRIALAVNLDLELVDPSEESRLTVLGVRHAVGDAMDVNRGESLIAEVGGGSSLLTFLRNGQIAASESFPLGSIRLQEMLATSHESPDTASGLLSHQISSVMSAMRRILPLRRVKNFVAIGGDARFAAQRVGRPTSSPDLFTVELKDYDELVAECVRHTADELARKYNLPFADAETLMPALLAYQAMVHATRAKRLIVCNASMRDGILLDLAGNVTGREDPGRVENVLQSARTIGEKYRTDAAHAGHVSDLAVRLFDALENEHGLASRHRLLLRVAGLLHETGGYVSSRSHHKHSYYLIANSEIFGLRKEEIAVVANVARYHRRSGPKPSHMEYMALPREHRMVVNKLAAILRVADALDRGHAQQVRNFQVELRDEEVVLVIHDVADLTLERRALLSKADLFEEIFGLRVRLEEASQGMARSDGIGSSGPQDL